MILFLSLLTNDIVIILIFAIYKYFKNKRDEKFWRKELQAVHERVKERLKIEKQKEEELESMLDENITSNNESLQAVQSAFKDWFVG